MQDANALHLPFEGLAPDVGSVRGHVSFEPLPERLIPFAIPATVLLSTAPRASAQTKTAAPDRVIPNPKRGGTSARLALVRRGGRFTLCTWPSPLRDRFYRDACRLYGNALMRAMLSAPARELYVCGRQRDASAFRWIVHKTARDGGENRLV